LLFATAAAVAASDEAIKTLRGKPFAFELDIPASWEVVSDQGRQITAIGDGVTLMVGIRQKSDDSSKKAKDDPNARLSEPTSITIDGRKWFEFTTILGDGPDALKSLVATYSGPEGSFMISGDTRVDQFEAKRALLVHCMGTFRFPKKAP
jgi:hypothetical protein